MGYRVIGHVFSQTPVKEREAVCVQVLLKQGLERSPEL